MPTMPKATRAPWLPPKHEAWHHPNRWAGYNSKAWRKASAQFKILHPVCATPGCNGATHATDHMRNIGEGVDPWDQSNWQPLCKRCHIIKTSKEGGKATAVRTTRDDGEGYR